MQLKYLHFHKLLSNFAQELVGAFIPLILYQETGNLALSISYYIFLRLFLLAFDFLFRKLYIKKPQLFLLLRIIPMIFYYLSILMIDKNIWVACIGIMVFEAMSLSFKYIPNDAVFNFNSLNSDSKAIGVIRVIERIGMVFAQILGALFLDTLSKEILIIVSLSIYLISILPLAISYFKYRKNTDFNVEGISNAQQQFVKNEEKVKKSKVITKKIFILYLIDFALFCMADLNTSLFGLFLYVKVDKYYIVGILSIIYYAIQVPFNLISSKIDSKKDLMPYVVISSVASGLLTFTLGIFACLPNYSNVLLIISLVLFLLMGIFFPCVSMFFYDRMLLKSKILGKSSDMLVAREFFAASGQLISVIPALFAGFAGAFMLMGIAFVASGIMLPKVEEKTRKLLVDYLQN